MNLNCRWAFLVHLIECAVHSELQWIKQNCFYHAGCFSYIYSIQNYTIICRCSGEVFLKCLVQWFAQGNEAEQARRPLLSDHSRPVRNEKCTADNLLWFGWCLNGTINFFCNIARCGKTVAAFYCLTCWRVGYESVIKTVMLFRLVVLEHSMPFFYAHMAGGIMFSGCLSHSRQCNISITPFGNFFKFGTDVRLDSGMNWWDFGHQKVRFQAHCDRNGDPFWETQYPSKALREFLQIWHKHHLHPRMNWSGFGGQGLMSLSPLKTHFSTTRHNKILSKCLQCSLALI